MKLESTPGGIPIAAASHGKWITLAAAFLGWMFDGFEMGLFPLVGRPALIDLLGEAGQKHVDVWFGLMIAGFLVGAATGGVLFGWLGDRLGRVRAMTLSIFTYAIFMGLCGVAKSPEQLVACLCTDVVQDHDRRLVCRYRQGAHKLLRTLRVGGLPRGVSEWFRHRSGVRELLAHNLEDLCRIVGVLSADEHNRPPLLSQAMGQLRQQRRLTRPRPAEHRHVQSLAQRGVDPRQLSWGDEQARISSSVQQGLVSQVYSHALHILL